MAENGEKRRETEKEKRRIGEVQEGKHFRDLSC